MLVDLPEYPRFSAQYTLCAQDVAALQRVFSHDLINALEGIEAGAWKDLAPGSLPIIITGRRRS